ALQFTGRRGYRVWVFLKQPLSPSIYPVFVKSLLGSLRLETLDLQASLDRRHLFRIPYTIHEAIGKRARFLDSATLEPIRIEDWDYQLYEPLDPRNVKIVKVVVEPPKAILASSRQKTGRGKTSYYNYIESILRNGLPDGRKRFILWVASRYLVNVKGLGLDEALGELEGFLEASCRNHGNCSRIYTSWLRSVLRAVKEGGYKPPSLRILEKKYPDLYQLLPKPEAQTLVMNKPKRKIRRENESASKGILSLLREFVEETGLKEFTYQNFKKWLETRMGGLTHGLWSKYTRQLRLLAEIGKLGRKFRVGKEWADYGSGPVENPPSRKVVFYLIEK
ncbi:MAG: DNA primase noncatalytic subunit PriX, partial [Desulfurococcales archaeon]|nr:DNA primase noncatalytic subunit PriX [Desulfurococcales archaeon]